jgi:hypothetical protein
MHGVALLLVIVVAFGSGACSRVSPTETKLIGEWSMPRGGVDHNGVTDTNSGFDVTCLKADHSFSQTAHPTQAPAAHVLSGSWRVEGNQRVMKFTWAHPTMQDMVGQELRLVISDVQPSKFVSANAQNEKQKFVWTRVK